MKNRVTDLNTSNNKSDNFLLNGVGNSKTTTNKFHGASSQEIIESLEDSGLVVRAISKPNARHTENLAYNKHIVRLTTPENIDLLRSSINTEVPEIIIVNNNNNRGSIQIGLGIYRLVCSNGMILGDTFFHQKVRHDSNMSSNLFNTLITARERFDDIKEIVAELKGIKLSIIEMSAFKEFIKQEVIIPNLITKGTTQVRVRNALNPQRREDLKNDAWVMMNRLQEYLLNGGIQYQKIVKQKDDTLKLVNGTTSRVKSVDKQVQLNKAMFDKTLEYFNVA